jgi:hypothetical protein
MKVQKYLIPVLLFFGAQMVFQGTGDINKDLAKDAKWATPAAEARRR